MITQIVLIVLLACLIFSVGGVMQKHGMATSFPKLGGREIIKEWKKILKTIVTNWIWVVGSLLVFAGFILHFQAVGMGDLSLVQPLFNIQIIFVVVIGVLVLREKMRALEYFGVAVLLAGALVISFKGGEQAEEPVLRGMQLLLLSVIVYGFMGLMGVLLQRKKEGSSFEIALASIGGLFVGMNAIFMKSATVMIRAESGDFNISDPASLMGLLGNVFFWIVVVHGLITTAVIQWAYTHGRAAIVIPVINTVQMVVPVIAGIIVFSEQLPAGRIAGIVVILVGTLLLNRGVE